MVRAKKAGAKKGSKKGNGQKILGGKEKKALAGAKAKKGKKKAA